MDFRLYLITDRRLFPDQSSFLSAVRQALRGGIRAVQLREKDLSTRDLLNFAYKMRQVTYKYNAKLFINDRLDIALAVDADGVHLTGSSIPVDAVRKVTGRKLIIGVSTHSLREAKRAEQGGADFITCGPVYRTSSKLKYGKPIGIDMLKRVCHKTGIPVFAIGGIKASRTENVINVGAYGIAVISEVFKSGHVKKKASDLTRIMGEKQY